VLLTDIAQNIRFFSNKWVHSVLTPLITGFVSANGTNIVGAEIQPLQLTPESMLVVEIKAWIIDGPKTNDLVNSILAGDAPQVSVIGSNGVTIISRVLRYFRWDLIAAPKGAKKASGGVFPQVNVTHINSTVDTFLAEVIIPDLDLGLPFPIYVGSIHADLYRQGGNITVATIDVTEFQAVPGKFSVYGNVQLTASNNRTELEAVLSQYVFGTSFGLNMRIVVSSPRFTRPNPIDIRYGFVFPPNPGGNDTSVIKCIEVTDMRYSGMCSNFAF
jgi:hypothetical protein